MAPNRITPAAAVRRALLLLALAAVSAAALGACGGGGGETTGAAPEQAADAEVLNEVLSRQSAVVSAYGEVLPALHGHSLALAQLFQAQEQEHIDGILKALRGMETEPARPAPETIEVEGLRTEADHLRLLYEIESATIEAELAAIAALEDSGPRTLLAATVANQAGHLVLLRRALGAGLLESTPLPFENGTTAAP